MAGGSRGEGTGMDCGDGTSTGRRDEAHLLGVGAIDDGSACVLFETRLGTELASEVLEEVLWGAREGLGDIRVVHDVSADAIASPFHLRHQLGHLIPAQGLTWYT